MNEYTRDGALIVWHDDMPDIMTGHRRRISGRRKLPLNQIDLLKILKMMPDGQ